jgi:hypothetical protein
MEQYKGAQRLSYEKCFLLILVCGLLAASPVGFAQVSTASVNGVVRDPTGAVVADATIVLQNVDTAVENTTPTNKSGVYSLFSIKPGTYTLNATAPGFSPKQIEAFPLTVGQVATIDIALAVGSANAVVTVQGFSTQLDVSNASLGTVIGTQQTNDLPLNGRNFTELLTLTPGVSAVNTAQNNGGGFATPAVITSDVVIPAINGQGNRSNMFLADGLNNFDNIVSTYTVPPIIDAIQEFKVVSHTDSAEYGGVIGGVINVDTKSGTNDLHGSAWEYARNSIFDARSYFLPTNVKKTPFSQNQFGGSIGGPVMIPKLYHGRNKTFFFGAYQGFRFLETSNNSLHVPTAAELNGDESDWPTQIYNPFTTRADPNNPGQYIADPFPGNQIPASLIQPGLVAYAKFAYPQAGAVFDNSGDNALDATPNTQNQNEWDVRIDEKVGSNDSAFFRYSAINSTEGSSGGLPGIPTASSLPGRDWGGSYVHVFSPSLVLQGQAARILQQEHVNTLFTKSKAAVQSALGLTPSFGADWIDNADVLPGIINYQYSNAAESLSYNDANDGYEYSAHLTKTAGSHALQFGGGYTTIHFGSNNTVGGVNFAAQNTADPNPLDTVNTGSPMASFLLGVPNSAYRVNKISSTRPGGELNGFAQDSWKATKNLTLNVGLRYDLTLIPPLGQNALTTFHGGPYIGDMDFTNGTYLLQKLPPACSATSDVAPCIPGTGALPANVVVSSNGKIAHNIYDNIGPRAGFAYRVGTEMVIHGGFGMVYDNWAALLQTIQNTGGTWPDVGGQQNSNLNLPSSASPTPTISYTSPFGSSGNGGLAPGSIGPFTQQNYFYDPHRKNPRSYQYNFGLQQQLNSTTTATLNYVGMITQRLDVGGFYNTALTPGPGDPQSRSLYPNIVPTPYDRSAGSSSFNGLEASLNKRFADGWSYSVAYTWSKTMNDGTDGFFGAEGGVPQDPYHPSAFGSRSVAGYDIPNNFSASLLYQIPYGVGKKFSSGSAVVNYVLGNWQINNILTAYSGLPFTPVVSSDIANTGNGNTYETLDVVGNPKQVAHRGANEWFNTAAYAVPQGYTYGTAGRNSLRSAGYRNLDTSVFRQFPIGEGRRFEFRMEAFNLLNEVVLSKPFTDFNSGSQFGTINGTANSARQVQLALKFLF